jgi:putative tricarboxylic transport membrane protein
MDIFLEAFLNVLSIKNIIAMTLLIPLGMMAGALPGFTATMAVAILVPFTFAMDPIMGLICVSGVYCAAIYGGAFPAILINTPGTPSSIATCFDGYPMTLQGRAQEALFTIAFASLVGGFIGTIGLIAFSLPLAKIALKFGPPEYFWVSIFGLTIIAGLSGDSLLKGIAGGVLGLLISTIGIAPVGGDVRFTFGIASFQGGVELISVLIGFFCIPEIFKMAKDPVGSYLKSTNIGHAAGGYKEVIYKGFKNAFADAINLVRSSIIGLFVGILPGAGGNIANLIAYNETKRASKDPESFGKGNPQGIVATESADKATIMGSFVPLLTLGVPGSPVAAVVYGALMIQGLNPGPELFTKHAEITYTFMMSFFVAMALTVLIGMFAGVLFYQIIMRLPVRVLVPAILLLTIVGSYAVRNNYMDVIFMLASGYLGYVLSNLGFSPGPVVLGLVLGPIAEKGLVQGFLMGNSMFPGTPWLVFFTRPISIVLIVISVISALWPIYAARRRRRAAL